ncbi:MAG: hypothetical protein BroJett042_32140 [Bacteroidota bacterium]|nr:MAG: hypothetical protein BroJett042_32140 [Bacteroidota bacterium]
MQRIEAKNIDEYLAAFNEPVKTHLIRLRETIRKAAPNAEEKMSYAIPTFFLGGKNLVHFAAFAKHIGFYPAPSAIAAFAKDLKAYPTSKGAVQFPLDKPLPLTLISKMVKYRVKENTALAARKKKKQS